MGMKRLLSIIFTVAILSSSLFIYTNDAQAMAGRKFPVKVMKCVDGDTAFFTKVGITRFLYIDTPESTNEIEPYGVEAAAYTCSLLSNAKRIELQFDGPLKDKYDRTLAWVWVDGVLLQRNLITMGYVEKFYDFGDYSYEKELMKLQMQAQQKKVGIWSSVTAPTPAPSLKSSPLKFKNCSELRRVYPRGVPSDHPSYEKYLDRDQDNFACER
jgi:micrococcal nuclease